MSALTPSASLVLDQATFEVRFAYNVLLWDRAGALWKTIEKRWPALNMAGVEPAQQTCLLEPNVQGTVEISKAHLIELKPGTGLKDFSDKAQYFIKAVQDTLEIVTYSRIGLRLQFQAAYESIAEASEALLARFGPQRLLDVQFSTGTTEVHPQLILRWVGEAVGCRLDVRAEETTISVKPPFGVSLEDLGLKDSETKRAKAVFDADYYTTAEVRATQLDPREWIKQAFHVVNRDIKHVWT